MNIKDTLEALPALKKAGLVPNLIGHHGIGKSTVVEKFARDNGYSYNPIFLGQLSDSGDLLGLPEFNRNVDGKALSTSFIHPDKLPKQPKSILFLDELSHAPKEIRGLLFQLILTGEMHDYKLPEDSFIVVAMNPDTEDYPCTLDFSNKAFGDRFVHINFNPTKQEFMDYMSSTHKGSVVNAFLTDQPTLLEDITLAPVTLDFVKPSRRSWDRFAKLEKVGVSDHVLRELAIGMVGDKAAIAYFTFKETQDVSLSGLDILDNYNDNNVQKILKKALDDADNQTEVFNKINDEILKEFEGKKEMIQSRADNLIAYSMQIPLEKSYYLLLSLFNESKVEAITGVVDDKGNKLEGYIVDNDEVYNYFKKHQDKINKFINDSKASKEG